MVSSKQMRKILLWLGLPFVFGLAALLLQGVIPGCRFLCQLLALACGYWIVTCVIYHLSRGKGSRKLLFKILFWMLIGAVALLAILFFTVEILIFSHSDGDAQIPPSARVLIVLGCQVKGETPSEMLTYRIDAAYHYMSAHPDTVAVLCGGQGNGETITEAECMFRELISRGISSDRLFLEDQSTDTAENVGFASQIVRELGYGDEVIVVSSGFHLLRGKLLCDAVGLKAYGVAGEMPRNPILCLNFYLREFASIFFMYADRIFA